MLEDNTECFTSYLRFISTYQKVKVLVTLGSKLLYVSLVDEKAKHLSTWPQSPLVKSSPMIINSLTISSVHERVLSGFL